MYFANVGSRGRRLGPMGGSERWARIVMRKAREGYARGIPKKQQRRIRPGDSRAFHVLRSRATDRYGDEVTR